MATAKKTASVMSKKASDSESAVPASKSIIKTVPRKRTAAPDSPELLAPEPPITAQPPVTKKTAGLMSMVVRPEYWEQACADLVKRDRIMKKLIPQFGPVHLKARGDPFVTLARSIVGQQISVAAAQAVWLRIEA